jgi:hypothetical protein
MFTICSNVASVNVFSKKYLLFQPNNGVNLLSCSHKIFKNFPELKLLTSFSNIKGPNNLPVLLLTIGKFPINQLSVFDLSNVLYNKHLYPIKTAQTLYKYFNTGKNKPLLIKNEIFKATASITPIIKQLITFLILYQNF